MRSNVTGVGVAVGMGRREPFSRERDMVLGIDRRVSMGFIESFHRFFLFYFGRVTFFRVSAGLLSRIHCNPP